MTDDDQTPQDAQDLDRDLDQLPDERKEEILHILQDPQAVQVIRKQLSVSYSSPIPPAAELERYNAIIPNAADRFMTTLEKEQDHRHWMNKRAINGEIWADRIGTLSGLLIGLFGLGVAGFLASHDKQFAAAVIAAVDIVGLTYVFVRGQTPPESSDHS